RRGAGASASTTPRGSSRPTAAPSTCRAWKDRVPPSRCGSRSKAEHEAQAPHRRGRGVDPHAAPVCAAGRLTLLFATDRAEALSALRCEQPALVSLDLGLPPHPESAESGL